MPRNPLSHTFVGHLWRTVYVEAMTLGFMERSICKCGAKRVRVYDAHLNLKGEAMSAPRCPPLYIIPGHVLIGREEI